MIAAAARRIGAIDTVRGAALAGMVVFHTAWDLRYVGLIDVDPSRSPAWRAFGDAVACAFLALSGLGLVLARRNGARMRDALRRIAIVALAALCVTLVTWAVLPGQVIAFGILHCIALGNLMALPLLDTPAAVPIVLGLLAAAAACLPHAEFPPALWWLGLAETPDTLDARPLVPWLAPILFGVALGRSNLVAGLHGVGHGRVAQWLRRAGRHSLAIYLLHQPLIIALLAAVPLAGAGATNQPSLLATAAEATAYLRQCRSDCIAKDADADFCAATCHCVLTALMEPKARRSMLDRLVRRSPDIAEAVSACLKGGGTLPPAP